jgi:putative ATP-dependent endonuclease of OLD family
MYVSHLTVRNFRQFGDGPAALELELAEGVTTLVGRNDSGKTAVIDAIRYALQTRDQEFVRVQPEDFHVDAQGHQAAEIYIRCKLSGLDDADKSSLVEYLSYDGGEIALFVNWTARRLHGSPGARRWIEVSVRGGREGTGPQLEGSVRELLAAAYLRPLRNAEREMTQGRGSRLSQILASVPEIGVGEAFDASALPDGAEAVQRLSLVGLSDYLRHNVKFHKGIGGAEKSINEQYLSSLTLSGENIRGRIDVTEGGTEQARLRQILERLELLLIDPANEQTAGRYGLGSNNLLYIACELLLLGREPEGLPLLLIEEPEAHLHPQRQLRLMEFLAEVAKGAVKGSTRKVQVILSTHSPNLASRIPLGSLVLLDGRRAFSLAEKHTRLEPVDYRFLERFLDVTKANLFFAHGVIVVEGDAEALLLPVLACLLGTDLTEHGVSIVNVGGTGLRRFSRIFQRAEGSAQVTTPVACITDLDVMPDCAPEILGLVTSDNDEKWTSTKRRWRARRDLGENVKAQQCALEERRAKLQSDDGQCVKTFVADHWTLEYDLAYCGLAEEVFVAAALARNDEPLCEGKKTRPAVITEAKADFEQLREAAAGDRTVLCSEIYAAFAVDKVSKAIAAQYLAEFLETLLGDAGHDTQAFEKRLPRYIVDAIGHVKPAAKSVTPPSGQGHAPDA